VIRSAKLWRRMADSGLVTVTIDDRAVEVPKGTGMNYSDGITPFVLAKGSSKP